MSSQSTHPPSSDVLLGEWTGGHFPTPGHPVSEIVVQLKWAGKRIHSEDDVEPILVYDDQYIRVWCEEWGRAKLREVGVRVVSTALVYDDHPIVDENTVAGMMDSKHPDLPTGFHFYIKRYKPEMSQ